MRRACGNAKWLAVVACGAIAAAAVPARAELAGKTDAEAPMAAHQEKSIFNAFSSFWEKVGQERWSRVAKVKLPQPGALANAPLANEAETAKVISEILREAESSGAWALIERIRNELLGSAGRIEREVMRPYFVEDSRFFTALPMLASCCRFEMQSAAVKQDDAAYQRAMQRWLLLVAAALATDSVDGVRVATLIGGQLLSHVYAHAEAGRIGANARAAFGEEWVKVDTSASLGAVVAEARAQALRELKTVANANEWDVKQRYTHAGTLAGYFDKMASFVTSHCLSVALPPDTDPFWMVQEQAAFGEVKLMQPEPLAQWASVVAAGRGFAIRVAVEELCAKGACPATLAEVTGLPEGLWRVDAFGGADLKYKPTAGGKSFVLYSVGPDGKDDGGQGQEVPGITKRVEHKGDLVFCR